ncbi:hypothetical protein H1R20_g8038, partial [Candolleomyces eurysporus]
MLSPVENPLNVFMVQHWKQVCINKALELNAYEILMGVERMPPSSDTRDRASFIERRSKLIGYIRSTLDHSQTTTIIGGIDILDAPAIWKQLLKAYKPKDAEGTFAVALSAASNQKKKKFHCEFHGKNNTHASKDCRILKGKQKQKAQIAEDREEGLTPEEKVMMAHVAHIASPPICRTKGSAADTSWNTDSGATSHMTPHRKWICNFVHCQTAVLLANNHVVWAKGKGDIFFNPIINGQPSETVTFEDALYVPDLQNNLFSILSAVRKNKMRVVIEGESLDFQKDGNTILTAIIHQNTGLLDGTTLNNYEHAYVTQRISKDLLHQQLGHIGQKRINKLIKQKLGTGIIVKPNTDIPDTCEHCIAGKQHRNPFPDLSEHRSTELLGRVHSDLHGPLIQTPSGFKYWITFIDDHSRFKEVHLLKSKDEASQHFKEYIAKVERQTGKLVKEIRDDKGGEYMSKDFINWCKGKGITQQHTVTATPQQNGVSERLNCTLAEGVVAMLNQALLPLSFWGAATLYYTDILNATPSSSTSNTTSYESMG